MTEKDTGEVLDWLDTRRARVLQIAAEEISSAAVKDSPRVREFWRVVAPKEWTPAQLRQAARQLEWCGVFDLWCYHEAKLTTAPWELGRGFAYRMPRTDDPRPGDLMIIPQPFWHHGLVESYYMVGDKPWLRSIEGNTPDIRRRDRPAPKGALYYSIEPWLRAALERETSALP